MRRSCGEAEVDDVAVLNDVLLALEPHFAVIAADGHRAACDQGVVADDFRTDEATGDVAVDFTGRQLRRRVARDRPGAALVLADSEERDVAEQIVAGANHAIEARRAQSEIGQKHLGVGRLELRDFELDFAADGDRRRFDSYATDADACTLISVMSASDVRRPRPRRNKGRGYVFNPIALALLDSHGCGRQQAISEHILYII